MNVDQIDLRSTPDTPDARPETATDDNVPGPSQRRQYFLLLDVVRAVAVLIVVVSHSSPRLLQLDQPIGIGWAGVLVFFVLSGFLITFLLVEEQQSTGGISLRDFFIRRGLRIWPLYYAVLATYAFVLPNFDSITFGGVFVSHDELGWDAYRSALWAHVFFLQNYFVSVTDVRLGLGVFWSLAVEEHFYLFWPVLVKLLPSKILGRTTLGLLGGATVVTFLYSSGRIAAGAEWSHWTHTNAYALLAGCSIGILWARSRERVREIPNRLGFALLVAGSVLVLSATLSSSGLVGGQRLVPVLIPGRMNFQLPVVLGSVLLILGCLVLPNWNLEARAFTRQFVKIGKVSYGIYLTHALVIGLLGAALRRRPAGIYQELSFTLGGIYLSVLLANSIYANFERPLLDAKKKFQRF